jgi:hypothetical protein
MQVVVPLRNGTSGNLSRKESEGHYFELRPLSYMRMQHLPRQSWSPLPPQATNLLND